LLPIIATAQTQFGYIDKGGNVIIAPTFKDGRDCSEGVAAVQGENNKWGFVDKTGKVVIESIYQYAADFKNGYCIVEQGSRWGLINKKGEIVIQPIYEFLSNYEGGIFLSKFNGQYALTNLKLEVVLDLKKYQYVRYMNDGCYEVEVKDVGYGIIDKTGKVLMPIRYGYKNIREFEDGYTTINIKENAFILDVEGKLTNCNNVESLFGFGNGLAAFKYKNADKYGYVNTKGNVIIEPMFENPAIFSCGRAITKKDGRYIMIDTKGNIVDIGNQYECMPFKEGLAKCKTLYSEFGFIDTMGKIIIAQKYIDVDPFSDGLARFKGGTGTGYSPDQSTAITSTNSNTSTNINTSTNKPSASRTTASGIQYSTADMSEFTNKYRLLGVMIIYSNGTDYSKPFPHYIDVYGTAMTNENAVFNILLRKLNSYYTYSKYSWKPGADTRSLTRGMDLRSYEAHGPYTTTGEAAY